MRGFFVGHGAGMPRCELGPAWGPWPQDLIPEHHGGGVARVRIASPNTPVSGRTMQRDRILERSADRPSATPAPQAGERRSLFGGVRVNLGGFVANIPVIGPALTRTQPPLVQFLPTPPIVASVRIAQPAPTNDTTPTLHDLPASGGRVTGIDPITGRAHVEVTLSGGRGTRSVDVDLPFPDAGFPDGGAEA